LPKRSCRRGNASSLNKQPLILRSVWIWLDEPAERDRRVRFDACSRLPSLVATFVSKASASRRWVPPDRLLRPATERGSSGACRLTSAVARNLRSGSSVSPVEPARRSCCSMKWCPLGAHPKPWAKRIAHGQHV
jgi:hypothetical protein